MSIKLSKLVAHGFPTALKKIAQTDLPVKTAYKILSLETLYNVEVKKYQSMRQSLLKKYSRLDEKGELKMDEKGMVYFDVGQGELFQADIEALLEVEIDAPFIKFAELGGATDNLRLSVPEVAAISGAIELVLPEPAAQAEVLPVESAPTPTA